MKRLKRISWLLAKLTKKSGEPVGVKLAPQVYDNWSTDADFILDNINKYGDQKPVGRFAYNPGTRELVIGEMEESHAVIIHNQATSPFDEFMRGVYDGHQIMLRWYGTDPYAGADEIKAQSFDAWWDTKQMLEANGMPGGMEVKLGVDTAGIKQELGDEMGRFYR